MRLPGKLPDKAVAPGMEAGPGRFTPHDEVDDLRWVAVGEAMDLLSYDRDRQVLARFSDE